MKNLPLPILLAASLLIAHATPADPELPAYRPAQPVAGRLEATGPNR